MAALRERLAVQPDDLRRRARGARAPWAARLPGYTPGELSAEDIVREADS